MGNRATRKGAPHQLVDTDTSTVVAELDCRHTRQGQKPFDEEYLRVCERRSDSSLPLPLCRQLGIDVRAYLSDILARVNTHPAERIGELLPDN